MNDGALQIEPNNPGAMPGELAELVGAFNEVTARLEATHESLRREVEQVRAELREANDQLERSRRLAALGEMAAGIAHEVRNPLASIALYARLLSEDLAGRPEQHELAVKIGSAVSHLDAVVTDVLTFSRGIRVGADEHDASELFDRAVVSCAVELDTVDVERADRRAGARARRVWCDAGLVHQALVNVIRNAGEAMREADAPTRRLTLDVVQRTRREGGGTAFVVSDTGPGVTDDVLARMFNPFFTTRHTGTGLGLAIVHRIVDAHDGRLVVRRRAELGQGPGTRVELVLPARAGVRQAA